METAEILWPKWPEEGFRDESEVSLQDASRDIWIGLPVMISRGRGKGCIARVLGTGSGWVQIRQAPDDGSDPIFSPDSIEVSKRAVDLSVIKGYETGDFVRDVTPPINNADDDVASLEQSSQTSQPADYDISIGDIVRVNDGTFEGKVGKVISSTRGIFTLSLRGVSSLVMKRKSELELVDKDSPDYNEFVMDNSRPSRFPRRRQEEFRSIADDDGGDTASQLDNDDESVADSQPDKEDPQISRVRSGARASSNSPKTTARGRRTGNRVAVQAGFDEESQGTQTTTRKRPGARRRNGAAAAAAARRNRELHPEQYSQTRLEATRRARQDHMASFVARCKERLERTMGMANRPNLQEWLDDILGCNDDDVEDDEDEYTPMVYEPAFCSTCLLEKEFPNEFCWNAACWECPVHNPGAAPLGGSAIPLEGAQDRFFGIAPSPRKSGYIDYTKMTGPGNSTFTECQPDECEERKHPLPSRFRAGRKRAEAEMVFSPLVSYSIHAPSKWIGEEPMSSEKRFKKDGYFGPGWKDGLVFSEPGLPNGEQPDCQVPALDLRWKRGTVI